VANPRLKGKLYAVAPLLLLFPLAMFGMALRDELKHGLWRPEKRRRPSDDMEGWMDYASKVVSRTGVLGPLQLLLDADKQNDMGRSFLFALAGPTATKVEGTFAADGYRDALTQWIPGVSVMPYERKWLMSLLPGGAN
jgi:hypothetical protein